MLRNDKQPEKGIIIEEIDSFGEGCRLLVIGHCVLPRSKVKGVAMLNLDTGEIERQRWDFDWYNRYHHPTGWDY